MVAKPFRALMICAGGMSSSLVEAHIRRAAEAAGVALDLRSISCVEADIWDFAAQPVEVLLVAPQVRFLRRRLAARLEPQGILVLPIEPALYGMAEGEAIFRQMLSALEGRGARRQAEGAPERIQKP